MKITFIGAFNTNKESNTASSPAGNQVQLEIFNSIYNLINQKFIQKANSINIRPIRTFPFGPLFSPGSKEGEIHTPPFINIIGLKRFIFSIFLFLILLKSKPSVIVKYNITLTEAIALRLYKAIRPSTFLVAIIQDIHYIKGERVNAKQLIELLAIKLTTRFDMLIPISEKIKFDFNFPTQKTRVFNGGLTHQGRSIITEEPDSLAPYAVFAGALTPYNGIDKLIKKWISEEIDLELHIFGKGILENFIRSEASKNSKIIFHGFKTEDEVSDWQKKAIANFCLRYSDGIEAGYFFPSKLFNIICAPGAVIVNNFEGFPSELEKSCLMLHDDLSDLSDKIKTLKMHSQLKEMRNFRRNWIKSNGDWSTLANEIIERAKAGGVK